MKHLEDERQLEADQFRVGDVWTSPRGIRYTVIRISREKSGRVAHMVNEKTQRTTNRAYDDLGWKTGQVWVRVSSGSE